jgi:hypothetical protein
MSPQDFTPSGMTGRFRGDVTDVMAKSVATSPRTLSAAEECVGSLREIC